MSQSLLSLFPLLLRFLLPRQALLHSPGWEPQSVSLGTLRAATRSSWTVISCLFCSPTPSPQRWRGSPLPSITWLAEHTYGERQSGRGAWQLVPLSRPSLRNFVRFLGLLLWPGCRRGPHELEAGKLASCLIRYQILWLPGCVQQC